AAAEHGVAKGDEPVADDARDRADGRGGDVAAHELDADRAAVDELGGRRGIELTGKTAARLNGLEAHGREEIVRQLEGEIAHAAEEDGRRRARERGALGRREDGGRARGELP